MVYVRVCVGGGGGGGGRGRGGGDFGPFSTILLETFVLNLVSLTCHSLQILVKTQTSLFLISGFLVNPL